MAKRKAAQPAETAGPPATEPANATPAGYTVLARRYRPQQFEDLVGQEAPARALVNALNANRVAHAYLFTGARGVGKTSTARILAKALNCVKGPTPTPCDTCDICRAIATGEDVDVLEIDGASNRGIDEVREIRQNVQYRPSRSRFKIYIIDEVHMLTPPAFNALLKTLEEPPAHVKFIFATTEVQRIPVTILSRCQRFDFAGIGTPRIVQRLREIVAAEHMEADDEALELVARRAGGSMRDAQSLLDQLLAFGGEGQANRLTTEQVHGLLGTANDELVAEIAGALLAHEPGQAIALLARQANQGLQLGELIDQLLAYWRDLMIISCAGAEVSPGKGETANPFDLSVPTRLRDTLVKQAKALKLDTILAGLDILAATKAKLRGSSHGRSLLEMALVRLGRLDDLMSLAQLSQLLAGGAGNSERPRTTERVAAAPAPSAERRTPAPERTLSASFQAESRPAPRPPTAAPMQSAQSTYQNLTPESLGRLWTELLAQMGPMMGANLEKAGIPAISGPNALVLRFPSEYNHQREYCQDPARMTRIEEALRKIAGPVWKVRIESTGPRPDTASEQPEAAAPEVESSQTRSRRQRDEASKEPLVKRAMEVLGAQILRVDEGFGAARATAPAGDDEQTSGEEP